jgi:hypothetical protein
VEAAILSACLVEPDDLQIHVRNMRIVASDFHSDQAHCEVHGTRPAREHLAHVLQQLEAQTSEPWSYLLQPSWIVPEGYHCPSGKCPTYRFVIRPLARAEQGFDQNATRINQRYGVELVYRAERDPKRPPPRTPLQVPVVLPQSEPPAVPTPPNP